MPDMEAIPEPLLQLSIPAPGVWMPSCLTLAASFSNEGTVRNSSKQIPSVSLLSTFGNLTTVLKLPVFVDLEGNKRDNLTIICEQFFTWISSVPPLSFSWLSFPFFLRDSFPISVTGFFFVFLTVTPASNLKKTGDMATGQVSFHSDKMVKRVHVSTRVNAIVNRLNKTKIERTTVDLEQEKMEHQKEVNRQKRAIAAQKVGILNAVYSW